ncbi:GNAT family N-acetyltransferase [Myxococcota bacterium]|nr:GNAT family N-acetyltransferase [Myxococcota bacterium]
MTTLHIARWPDDQADLYLVRREVFIEEQHVPPEIEIDEHDHTALHLLLRSAQGEPIACARLLPSGKIGRMAVRKPWRSCGFGRWLLEALVAHAQQQRLPTVYLSAQTHAIGFYERFGFTTDGPVYEEAGIPHQKMSLSLP